MSESNRVDSPTKQGFKRLELQGPNTSFGVVGSCIKMLARVPTVRAFCNSTGYLAGSQYKNIACLYGEEEKRKS